ncbi:MULTISPECIES: tripartite tricarboxylate transporter substrate binding protein [unclassified Cupriavidus]|uniref:Bug family tripartite tricarboxylate transporter substrate binding protein n=1 Tax=unclassified Cupriavidus TaxID=2640874 RepID=UPI000428F4BE|nr:MULTISPECIES: tripartite tricarboxylate transporter substrate binding protein [unclassified Cupriavidus]MBP0631696.1 tripartite tricarboxylate transporter substrate binding protein [Cupriavidus sp. AcVe19-1a]
MKHKHVGASLLRALALAALAAMSMAAQAQGWPAKPVKIIVPYPPGGAVDAVTRKMAQRLSEQTGQSFYVENKAGATGTIGSGQVARATPDGYTLLANDTTYALLPHIFKSLPFDPAKDLQPVAAYVFAPMGVVVKAGGKYKTLADLIAAAKSDDTVSYGSGGPGSTPHFASEALGLAAGAHFMHVPFKGAGEATVALLGGTVDFQMASIPGVIGQVKGNKLAVLAVSGTKRLPALAGVPTFAEAGVKGYGVTNFTGLWAPNGTPPDVLGRIQKEVSKAMATPDMQAYAESIGAEPGYWDAGTFRTEVANRTAFWGKVARGTGFQKQ